jgi:hypothetical protein
VHGVFGVCFCLTLVRNVEATYASVTRHMDEATRGRYNTLVLELYSQIIGILPLAANFGIDHKSRLRAVVGTDRIARNAASRAMLVGRVCNRALLELGSPRLRASFELRPGSRRG